MTTDIEIARAAKPQNINKIADKCNIITYDYESYSIDIFNSNNKCKS